MSDSRADIPKTDRELLLQLDYKIDSMMDKIQGKDGKGGICADLANHGERIRTLENWRWYIFGGLSIITLILVLFGRYLDLGGQI